MRCKTAENAILGLIFVIIGGCSTGQNVITKDKALSIAREDAINAYGEKSLKTTLVLNNGPKKNASD
jgi:hypothetical protein